jgi:hypothetical protein
VFDLADYSLFEREANWYEATLRRRGTKQEPLRADWFQGMNPVIAK